MDTDITVYSGNYTKIIMTIGVPEEQMQIAGGPQEFEKEVFPELESELGEEWTWRKIESKNSTTHFYEIKSSKIKINEDEIFTWDEFQYNNRKAYRFEFTEIDDLQYLENFSVTLHAGNILESNGTQVDSDTVTWINPRTTPYAIVIPKGSIQWIPILAIGALSLLFVAFLFILLLSGKLKKWGEITLSSSKWQLQATKLGGERKKIEQEKANLITNLGNQAWSARVYHADYDEQYSVLENLETQSKELNEKLVKIESQLGLVREERNKIDKEYTTQLNGFQAEAKEVNTRLSQAQTKISTTDKQITRLAQEQTKMHSEIQTFRTKLSEVELSDSPEKDSQILSYKNAISAVENSIISRASESETLQNEKIEFESSLEPIQDQINLLNQKIDQVKGDQKSSLSPLDQNIAELSMEVKNLKNEISSIRQKMSPLINNLGSLVINARPESENLSSTYQQIDRVKSQLTSISIEHDLLKTRLETADKSAIRNFIISIIGLLFLAIAIIVLVAFFLAT
ncbi:MAG: hypothetical protein Q7U53_17535 [Anaerolineaceae bacterium]|nr:hypothetical protein [Anaerolineaceae bacterium]